MKALAIFGNMIFIDDMAEIQTVYKEEVISASSINEMEEIAEQKAKEYNTDWIIPVYSALNISSLN